MAQEEAFDGAPVDEETREDEFEDGPIHQLSRALQEGTPKLGNLLRLLSSVVEVEAESAPLVPSDTEDPAPTP